MKKWGILLIKVVILDFDGVIVESVEIKTQAFKDLFINYPNYLDEIMNYHIKNNAISRYVKFKYIYENILKKKYSKEVESKLGREFSNLVFKKVVNCPFVSGVTDFLNNFYKKIPLYIISATPQAEINKIIMARSLGKYFKGIFGSPPGNKIDFIKNILEYENVKPGEALYIGDMIKDYKIAQKTGLNFIARKNVENFDNLDVRQYSNFTDISNWLKNKITNQCIK